MDLEQIPAGELGNAAAGDVWSRLRASHQRLQEKAHLDLPMPHEGLVLRCRKPDLEAYRSAVDALAEEWQRWAQLLIAACEGFVLVEDDYDPDDPATATMLIDEFGEPVLWDTLAKQLGLELDPDLGVRGLVRDVFPAEVDMVAQAQKVDDWINRHVADQERDLAKG